MDNDKQDGLIKDLADLATYATNALYLLHMTDGIDLTTRVIKELHKRVHDLHITHIEPRLAAPWAAYPPPEGEKWHNPNGLTPAQVGVKDGWRLALVSEVRENGPLSHKIECWVAGVWNGSTKWYCSSRNVTYRTREPLPGTPEKRPVARWWQSKHDGDVCKTVGNAVVEHNVKTASKDHLGWMPDPHYWREITEAEYEAVRQKAEKPEAQPLTLADAPVGSAVKFCESEDTPGEYIVLAKTAESARVATVWKPLSTRIESWRWPREEAKRG